MKISGRLPVFATINKGYKFFTGSIDRKENDDTFLSFSIDVRFAKKSFSNEWINAFMVDRMYMMNIQEAFLSVDSYKDKEGNDKRKLVIVVMKADIIESKPVEHKKELPDIPF